MKLYRLCADRADPRRDCKGVGCRCRGAYRFVVETSWRPAGQGEVDAFCRGCGDVTPECQGAVDVVLACVRCGAEQKTAGTSRVRTALWRLFGRHEGYNDWNMRGTG